MRPILALGATLVLAACIPAAPISNVGTGTVAAPGGAAATDDPAQGAEIGPGGGGPASQGTGIGGDYRSVSATFQGLAVQVRYSPSNAGPTFVVPTDPLETLPDILFEELTYTDLILRATRCQIAAGTQPRIQYSEDFKPIRVEAFTSC